MLMSDQSVINASKTNEKGRGGFGDEDVVVDVAAQTDVVFAGP
jgi:hypothetical protein